MTKKQYDKMEIDGVITSPLKMVKLYLNGKLLRILSLGEILSKSGFNLK